MDKNSMIYWWPLVKDLDIPMPRTYMIGVERSCMSPQLRSSDNPRAKLHARTMKYLPEIRHAVKFCGGYPIFMRTDLMSGKFEWSRTCYCETEPDLIANIHNLVVFSENCDMIGRPMNALVFREYIRMESAFAAFHGLPISRERRYFVRDGNVTCHHPYWPEEAIKFYSAGYQWPDNWVQDLACLNYEDIEEVELVTDYARKIGSVLPGYWSVDFCKSLRYGWYFIDCALGDDSWHPDCQASQWRNCEGMSDSFA